ncbi:MAG: GAF domain-containing protein [Nitrospirae bacterium]|nr:GAF domain-containing protein [Nitrospirota bacterium]
MQVRQRLKINAAVLVITAVIILLILPLGLYHRNNADESGKIVEEIMAGAGIVFILVILVTVTQINSWMMGRTIKERKRVEDRISRLNRLYSVLSKVNETIVRIHDSGELFDRVCRIAVEDGLFKMAWIGLIDPDSQIVKPIASYGDTDGYLNGVKVYAADVPEGKGPTGTACFEDKHSIAGDIENDPRMLPWRDRALRHGLRSSAAFPIHAGSSVIGALTVYSPEPQFFTDEEIQLLISLAEDVSFAIDFMANEEKRLEAEEALRVINEELEQRIAIRTADLEVANKELEAFSYSVSHDLRGPLRHMSGFVEMLQQRLKDHPDEKSRSYADKISEASKKMGMLIDNLLNFSRLGRSQLQKRKVNLNALVSEVIREIQEEVKERDIRWEIDELPDELGDQSLLRLVFVNLISNAVKFTSTRPQAEIKIGCKDEGDKFTCFISDNGVGFDMKYADKLFGVFQRLHRQDEFEGTGIGLANVQRIISRHGGRVWAEGSVDQGATFYFSLPKHREA